MRVDDGTIPDLAMADGSGGIHQTKFIKKSSRVKWALSRGSKAQATKQAQSKRSRADKGTFQQARLSESTQLRNRDCLSITLGE